MLQHLAPVHEHHVVGQPPGLAHVVSDEDDLGAAVARRLGDVLDHQGRGRVQVGRRLVHEQHVRFRGQGAGQGQALLLAAGEQPRRLVRMGGKARVFENFPPPRRVGPAAQAQHEINVGGDGAAQHHRALEHHGLTAADGLVERTAAPGDAPARGFQQSVHEAQQQAFPGPVGAHDDGHAVGVQGQVDTFDQHRAAGLIGQVLDGDGEQVGPGAGIARAQQVDHVGRQDWGAAKIRHRPAFSPSR